MSEYQRIPKTGASQPNRPTRQVIEESAAEILAAVTPVATAAAAVAKAYIDQKGETRRAEITADVERERIHHQPPTPPAA